MFLTKQKDFPWDKFLAKTSPQPRWANPEKIPITLMIQPYKGTSSKAMNLMIWVCFIIGKQEAKKTQNNTFLFKRMVF